jgi:hypothetical protein
MRTRCGGHRGGRPDLRPGPAGVLRVGRRSQDRRHRLPGRGRGIAQAARDHRGRPPRHAHPDRESRAGVAPRPPAAKAGSRWMTRRGAVSPGRAGPSTTCRPPGEAVRVRETANLHTGGTLHDVTDASRRPCARGRAAARALKIPVVGLDLMVPDPAGEDYVFIEANERPGLANHEPQPTAERFIDFLFPQTMQVSDAPWRLISTTSRKCWSSCCAFPARRGSRTRRCATPCAGWKSSASPSRSRAAAPFAPT